MDGEADEAAEKLAEIQSDNMILEMENKLLNLYANRMLQATSEDPEESEKAARKASRKSGKKERLPQELTLQQKYEIANTEGEVTKGAIEECKTVQEKLIDDLRALLEEADIKIAEISKDQYEFKRDVNTSAPGKPMAEKVLHFLEEKLRNKDSVVGKLTLKNGALKQQILKMENQLQHKEEMGEVLHVIDFDQLKIENQQYLEKIEERNNELLKLKLTTGNIVQTLNASKKRLNRLMVESETLKRMIVEKQALTKKVQEEIDGIEVEKVKVKKANAALQKQIEESGMPEVLEYVTQKATAHQLKKDLANYERKVEIAEMELRRLRTQTTMSRGGLGATGLGTTGFKSGTVGSAGMR
mmetsp:Transcript_1281/g.2519  ORF Transcript_1281/g.2519 Transcript_1281/m.2519 type:complete len:357 (-) Transcript_1281:137-1207(-)|eukprot:CAMPEP_0181316756 /NCGR_PEP_ID=MMETSP1101-20121128/16067_1 /TAXON_ID=46948 /ORGANISM="Rhodomonas abbreviata, Strain Caron Lab Isolate" /LENGTH=356 /DNA_ID=CAMNT_0023424029 /DNA_START=178 /DNA_END=1248 /DNA_ORIENTATION=-